MVFKSNKLAKDLGREPKKPKARRRIRRDINAVAVKNRELGLDIENIDFELVSDLCRLGLTNEELARFLGVPDATLRYWIKTHADFGEAIFRGRQLSDAKVAHSLYKLALGFEYQEEKAFLDSKSGEIIKTKIQRYSTPNSTACLFWLKNRHSSYWRDKSEISGPDGGAIPLLAITDVTTTKEKELDVTPKDPETDSIQNMLKDTGAVFDFTPEQIEVMESVVLKSKDKDKDKDKDGVRDNSSKE